MPDRLTRYLVRITVLAPASAEPKKMIPESMGIRMAFTQTNRMRYSSLEGEYVLIKAMPGETVQVKTAFNEWILGRLQSVCIGKDSMTYTVTCPDRSYAINAAPSDIRRAHDDVDLLKPGTHCRFGLKEPHPSSAGLGKWNARTMRKIETIYDDGFIRCVATEGFTRGLQQVVHKDNITDLLIYWKLSPR